MSTQTRQQEAEIILRRTSTLGEGALWDAEKQRLYWVDILEHKVFCFDPKTGENQEFDVGEEVGTVVLTQDEMLLVALSSGIALLDPKTQKITRLSDPRQHASEGRFNDGKCDPEGRFWVGTYSEGVGQAGKGALYCLDTDLRAAQKLGNVTCSNGLCFSADQRTFYYVDTPTYRIAAFDFEPATGAITNRRAVAELTSSDGAPDGMTIDSEGQLWVALFDGGKVLRIDPKTSARTYQVLVPEAGSVTSCAFGGNNLDHLYITTARVALSPEDLKTRLNAGSLFVARVPFRGVELPRFAGNV